MKTPPKKSARFGERKLEVKRRPLPPQRGRCPEGAEGVGAPPTQRVGGMKFFGRAAALSRGALTLTSIFREMCRGGLHFLRFMV